MSLLGLPIFFSICVVAVVILGTSLISKCRHLSMVERQQLTGSRNAFTTIICPVEKEEI